MITRRFAQVDVFADQALEGNPLAVVIDAVDLDDAQMAAFARWTNLSETAFLLPPTLPGADYRVRIFTPGGELPFAGHPTLGSCHVWLSGGGKAAGEFVVQQCEVGLVRIRQGAQRLAFAAPPLLRTGPVAPDVLAKIALALGLTPTSIIQSQWVDNGPGWVAVMIDDRQQLLAVQPDYALLDGLQLGVVARWPDGPAQFEVRAFIGSSPGYEDPVTGSLNASLAQWLMACGLAPDAYVASQGTAMGRAGRVYLDRRAGDVWVGGNVVPLIEGVVRI